MTFGFAAAMAINGIVNGKILEMGSHEVLMNHDGYYRDLITKGEREEHSLYT